MPTATHSAAPSHLDLPLLNGDAGTAWANLGDWSAATTYPAAARALAQRLGEAAGLGPGQRIFDAGVGAGEQLLLWSSTFGVSSITACDGNAMFASAARERIRQAGLDERVSVVVADATSVRLTPNSIDAVLALDSAYHFADRGAFFRDAVSALRPGGRLALTDLVLGTVAGRWTSQWGRIAGIAPAQLTTVHSYQTMLQQVGLIDVQIEDISSAVLAGFADWARAARLGLIRRAPRGGWPGIMLTGMIAGHLHNSRQLSYVLVTATKPSP